MLGVGRGGRGVGLEGGEGRVVVPLAVVVAEEEVVVVVVVGCAVVVFGMLVYGVEVSFECAVFVVVVVAAAAAAAIAGHIVAAVDIAAGYWIAGNVEVIGIDSVVEVIDRIVLDVVIEVEGTAWSMQDWKPSDQSNALSSSRGNPCQDLMQ